MKMNAEQIKAGLANFYGTERYHRLTICGPLLGTDGVAWLAQNAQCFWLIDAIAVGMQDRKVRQNEACRDMQFWTLKVQDSKGTLTCDDGNGNVVYTFDFTYTDFPLPEIKIWCGPADERHWVAMLPSEY